MSLIDNTGVVRLGCVTMCENSEFLINPDESHFRVLYSRRGKGDRLREIRRPAAYDENTESVFESVWLHIASMTESRGQIANANL